jgi:phosphomannomutase
MAELRRMKIKISSFKAYDIRGQLPHEINPEIAYRVGNATAEYLSAKKMILGRDIRASSKELSESMASGLMDAGVDVIDIGECGTENVYYATGELKSCGGVMVTASHNPSDYNGFKIVSENAKPISSETGLLDIRKIAESDKRLISESRGNLEQRDLNQSYVKKVLSFIDPDSLSKLKVVMNPGNGGAGVYAEYISKNIPIEIIKLNFDPDSSFPNGIPNPMIEENRASTSQAVIDNKADLGIAWDGDFDRCFFFDEKGNFIEGYYLVGLLAKSFLIKNRNERVIYDPRLTWNTIDVVERYGGDAIQCQSGHSFIKKSMRDNDAVYGGEMSAHHYFRDFYYCDSGMIPWLLILEMISKEKMPLSQMIQKYRERYPVSGEINLKVNNIKTIIDSIKEYYLDDALGVDETDGVGMEFEKWRFNLRASNTEPLIRLNVESYNNESLMNEKTRELVDRINNLD